MRSLVTWNSFPTSSSVRLLPSSSPNLRASTFFSRSVSVCMTSSSCSCKSVYAAASAGTSLLLSLIKSPRCVSSSFPDRRFQRDRVHGDLENLFHTLHRHLHHFRNLCRTWFTAKRLCELSGRADRAVDRLYHVHRNPDRSRLICDRPGNRLTDPPCSIGTEFITFFDSQISQQP